jgi:hypothetical protein
MKICIFMTKSIRVDTMSQTNSPNHEYSENLHYLLIIIYIMIWLVCLRVDRLDQSRRTDCRLPGGRQQHIMLQCYTRSYFLRRPQSHPHSTSPRNPHPQTNLFHITIFHSSILYRQAPSYNIISPSVHLTLRPSSTMVLCHHRCSLSRSPASSPQFPGRSIGAPSTGRYR